MLILAAVISAAIADTSFVLFNEKEVPAMVEYASLGAIEARRIGVASTGALEASRGAWPNLRLDPFAMPTRSLTLVVSGLTRGIDAVRALEFTRAAFRRREHRTHLRY
jgi:hypothetical protein